MLAPFRVKICGITSVEDAVAAAEAGADAIGLNFYAKSPRHVEREQAKTIADAVRGKLQIVGLFVNAGSVEISQLHALIGFTAIQLHGDEVPAQIGQLQERLSKGSSALMPIIRAFRLKTPNFAPIQAFLTDCQRQNVSPSAVLVDAFSTTNLGGTGKTLDWNALASQWQNISLPAVLAGGLTPQNVRSAILSSQALAVDTASGVELSPGKKDAQAMNLFVSEAKAAWTELKKRSL